MNYAENRYASMERNPDGTWAVFNDVTGLLVADHLTREQARRRMVELDQHYAAIEFRRS